MARGDWLEGYGLAPDPEAEQPSNGELLHFGCSESLISLELGERLIHASRNLPYRSDAPLRLNRGKSLVWLRGALLQPACVNDYRSWMNATDPCESPAEAVAVLSLCASLAVGGFPLLLTKAGEVPQLPELDDRMTLTQITLQEPAEDYRIDIGLHFNCKLGRHIYSRDVAIECDGDEYHSTDRQLVHDSVKTRVLREVGFSVYRFSGAQIWNDGPNWSEDIIFSFRHFCGELIHGQLPQPAVRRNPTIRARHNHRETLYTT